MRFGNDEVEKAQLTDVGGEIRAETEKAFLFYDGAREAWVPKQFVENNRDGTFTMPIWLAKAKGFI